MLIGELNLESHYRSGRSDIKVFLFSSIRNHLFGGILSPKFPLCPCLCPKQLWEEKKENQVCVGVFTILWGELWGSRSDHIVFEFVAIHR